MARIQGGRSLQKDLIAAIYQESEQADVRGASAPSIPLLRVKHLWTIFLNRLRYSGMEDRESRIAKAHEKTFEWIFSDQHPQQGRWSNFKDWLDSDSRLYWITGKAGSGKSTLIKYICQTDERKALETSNLSTEESTNTECKLRCTEYLRRWAGASRLITATFFFWNSGVQLQMAQKGLLLSLLYQILRQVPDLIATVSPKQWEALCLFDNDPREWSEPELQHMLRTCTIEVSKTMKLCVFVDGLDEFEGQHQELIRLFKDLIQYNNVKVCVSSRPWVIFEDAFQHKPSMMLQDLTYSDIKHYVTTNLQGDLRFAQLQQREHNFAKQLIENVVSKASGVFLWVHLVVASLLAGIDFGDRILDLQKRLDLLPPDLEKLYDKILRSLDPFYLEHAAQLFKLVEKSYDPPPLLLLSFADEEDFESAIHRPVKPISQEDLSLRAETMGRRLNSRCKGFLEVGTITIDIFGSTEETVQYLHRTVKDYVESREAQQTLGTTTQSSFDPHQRLCAGSLTHLKVVDDGQDFMNDGVFWARVQRCLYSGSRIQPANRTILVPILDELDKTGNILAKRAAKNLEPWSVLESQSFQYLVSQLETGQWVPSHPKMTQGSVFGANFLSLVVRYGIVDYVAARANRGCLVQHFRNGVWPLLLDAIYVDLRDSIGMADTVPLIDMIACLLKKGADPNYCRTGIGSSRQMSVWLHTVKHILENWDGAQIKPPWKQVAELMIKHGADINEKLAYVFIERKECVPKPEGRIPFSYGWYPISLFKYFASIKRNTTSDWFSWAPWTLSSTLPMDRTSRTES